MGKRDNQEIIVRDNQDKRDRRKLRVRRKILRVRNLKEKRKIIRDRDLRVNRKMLRDRSLRNLKETIKIKRTLIRKDLRRLSRLKKTYESNKIL